MLPEITTLPSFTPTCCTCADGTSAPFPFTMAFQLIVNTTERRVYAYEALVRGPKNESAGQVLSQVTPSNPYSFDQSCRVRAIELASEL